MIERHELSNHANADELRYRNDVQLNEDLYNDVDKWSKRQEQNKVAIVRFLDERGLIPAGEGLEIGAGTCWFSAELSKLDQVKLIHALDFSEVLLTEVAPKIVERRGGKLDKIRFHVGDFHDLPFPDSSLDFVVADAALHHTNELDALLADARRVLKPGGTLLAIHEPGVPRLLTPFNRFLVVNHGGHEKQFGIIENIYPEGEWRDYFERTGFAVRFVPYFGRRANWRARLVAHRPFIWLNGLMFWSKVIVAKRVP
jgi:ubiquinone/menaquinone biosynthesis C-methylase UbiE